ncbi:MAG: hypothetical protein M3498_01000 [Deinococcota bacterium]|jgi:hypothetical protein|nr:hypothetical protein [Deinococcota bacterium]
MDRLQPNIDDNHIAPALFTAKARLTAPNSSKKAHHVERVGLVLAEALELVILTNMLSHRLALERGRTGTVVNNDLSPTQFGLIISQR